MEPGLCGGGDGNRKGTVEIGPTTVMLFLLTIQGDICTLSQLGIFSQNLNNKLSCLMLDHVIDIIIL